MRASYSLGMLMPCSVTVTGNDYHKRRKEFKARPKWWGSKPWHRKPRPAQQRDERVVAKVPAGKWGKDDLSR